MGSRLERPGLYVRAQPCHLTGADAVVLLHGLGSSSEDWPLQLPALSRSHDVYAVDLPGHGQSPSLQGWPRMEEYAGAVANWMRAGELERAHIIGLSLGGLVALQLAVDDPYLVQSLTIVNGFGHIRVGARGAAHSLGRVLLLLFGRMDWLGAWVAAALFPEPEQAVLREMAAGRIAGNTRRSYLQAVAAIARFDVEARLSRVRLPALVIAGERDQIVPLQVKRRLAERIEGARFEIIPESGHVTPIDASERFNQLLLEFIR